MVAALWGRTAESERGVPKSFLAIKCCSAPSDVFLGRCVVAGRLFCEGEHWCTGTGCCGGIARPLSHRSWLQRQPATVSQSSSAAYFLIHVIR